LKASKHSDNLTLTMTYPNPIVTVEVVGTSQADARETTQLTIDRLRASSDMLQKGSGVTDTDLITMQRLDQGQNVSPSLSKVKRAIFAVGAAGLVMTTGGTLGFDAFARRRARKRKEREQEDSTPQNTSETEKVNGKEVPSAKVPVVQAQNAEPVGRATSAVPPPEPSERPVSPAVAPLPRSADRTAIVVKRTASVAAPAQPRAQSAATYQSANAHTEADGENHDGAVNGKNGNSAAPSDVRVVLQPKRLGGENGGKSD
jgi:hypothetical protein